MSYFRLILIASLTMALLAACAGLEEQTDGGPGDPEPQTKTIELNCVSFVAGEGVVDWELTVDPGPIVSGKTFAADLKGKVIFDEFDVSVAQIALEGGFKDAMIVDAQATVRVRKGATGEDVVLEVEPIPYVCAVDRTLCDPENDLPGTPGIRGNTDCQPEGAINPCGRFIEIPTSDDCAPGGFCEREGWTEQCELNGFCVSGRVEVPLVGRLGSYRADGSGSVLFGFDDQESTTGFETLQEGGCNDGTWTRPPSDFEDPPGPNSARLLLGGIPLALECVMGVQSRGPFGIDSCDALSSPTPDSQLISFPIQTP